MPTKTVYGVLDLKRVMDSGHGWARDWDDMIYYADGPAAEDLDMDPDKAQAVKDAFIWAKQHDVRFTLDYRRLWHAMFDEPTDQLPPPDASSSVPASPIELRQRWLAGVMFPASGYAVADRALHNGAPWRVQRLVDQLPRDRVYEDMDQVLDDLGDLSWNPG